MWFASFFIEMTTGTGNRTGLHPMSHGWCTLSHVSYATQPRYCRNYALKIYDARRNRRNAPSVARFSSPLRPCMSVSVFHGIISTVSKQLRYSHAGKLCVPVGQPGLTVIYSRKISSEVKMQIPRCQVLQAQYLWHDLRFLRMPCLQRPLQFSPKGV